MGFAFFTLSLIFVVVSVSSSCEQRNGGRLRASAAYLQLHQRVGLRFPPAQSEEWPAAQALWWPQIWREEDRGGGVRPLHSRSCQGAGDRRRQVERRGAWDIMDRGRTRRVRGLTCITLCWDCFPSSLLPSLPPEKIMVHPRDFTCEWAGYTGRDWRER